jgi:hypothetical protein
MVSGGDLFAGTAGGVFRSTNSGSNWTSVSSGLTDLGVPALAVDGTSLFAGTFSGGAFVSSDKGGNWTPVNSGLTSPWVNALAVIGGKLFAGTQDAGVFMRPLSEMIMSVAMPPGGLPARYSLEQNYPNPFNPSTTIKYGLPESQNVKLEIFNTLGQSVAVLVDSKQETGYHEVAFDASRFSSGVYLYRIQAGKYVAVKKMLVLK